ncbi:MAG: tRNA (adenine(22)-N(1))-methyltransferase TrmK [Ectothiorhodospiraceae bacterium]|nr:tRNA (adenine(22)-N(1))-methyltransferase TrmK [Ectothiorhodospiraceae bacterium]
MPHTFSSVTTLFLVLLLSLSACTHHNGTLTTQKSAITHPIDGATGELFLIGQDPDHKDRRLMRVKDTTLTLFKNVEGLSPDSMHLLNHTTIHKGETVLDLGTGPGVQAIFAARKAKYVVATDISPQAGENARINIAQLKLAHKIDVRVGDLFAPLSVNERFDVILFNLRYPTNEASKSLWNVHKRFFAGVKNHLEPDGRIYYQFGFERNMRPVKKMLLDNQLYIAEQRSATSSVLENEKFITLEIRVLPVAINP